MDIMVYEGVFVFVKLVIWMFDIFEFLVVQCWLMVVCDLFVVFVILVSSLFYLLMMLVDCGYLVCDGCNYVLGVVFVWLQLVVMVCDFFDCVGDVVVVLCDQLNEFVVFFVC